MTSFSEVLGLAKTANDALNAVEDAADAHLQSAFVKFQNGYITLAELRLDMLNSTQAGYITAGTIANNHMTKIADDASLPAIDTPLVKTSPALASVLDDISRNMGVFEYSERDATALRRLRFRTSLSVQHAVRRGFTENQLATGKALSDAGASVHKMWLANFLNNSPCPTCRALHGTELDLSDEFDHGDAKAPKTYLDLLGPPRHPHCHCYLLVYVVTLDTVSQAPAAPILEEQKYMHSHDIRKLPRSVYIAALTTLRLIAGLLKGAIRGKR